MKYTKPDAIGNTLSRQARMTNAKPGIINRMGQSIAKALNKAGSNRTELKRKAIRKHHAEKTMSGLD